ncbi:hypothetical protein BJP36_06350 [Moorena producens JHB]|uniref:Uncharacterized protein n=1 Tax=Moorena producens (strain JHB) TaxID=1454205 RepID=A0A1D9FW71_MOOP1|nr:cyanobactin class RiPP [Moorena producens]AOY79597.1 hypothetical protein BJP36_06350 [Moorena producens JHB]
MGKKNLLPGQKSPIVRSTTAKPIRGLEETTLRSGLGNCGSITPSSSPNPFNPNPFAGDGEE